MNCLTPSDAVHNILDSLHKPFTEWIDYFHDTHPQEAADLLLKPLETLLWFESSEYRDMKFEEDTFESIYHSFHRFFGQSAAFDFLEELTQQVKDTVKGRIEYWKEKEAEEQQQLFRWELRQGIENDLRPPASA